MADNRYFKPLEKKAVPTTDKSAVRKIAERLGIKTINEKYRDVKENIKQYLNNQAAQVPPVQADNSAPPKDAMQDFMQRHFEARAAAAQPSTTPAVLPSGAAATLPRPPQPASSSVKKGGSKALGEVQLNVCQAGVPMSRIFNCSPPF